MCLQNTGHIDASATLLAECGARAEQYRLPVAPPGSNRGWCCPWGQRITAFYLEPLPYGWLVESLMYDSETMG